MTKIIGFAGKKQSGKNTACNFNTAIKLAELGICKTSRLSEDGGIEVTDILGEKPSDCKEKFFPFKEPYVDVKNLFENELSGFIKIYALADTLKSMAVSVLGLSEEQVFGTDEDKNSKTSLRWEDMPGVISPGDLKKKGFTKDQASALGLFVHAKGKMTAREVLQFVGTDIFRKMNHNVWLDSFVTRVNDDGAELALVSDVRFDNEIKGIQKSGGFVIGLTRDIYEGGDKHSSETELEEAMEICDVIIDNSSIDISQQSKEIYMAIKHFEDVVPKISEEKEEQ